MDKWVEIDSAAVRHNLQEVRSLLDPGTRLIAVIKANAYGHGAPETARILSEQGVDFFAVSFVSEALQLRESGIKADILVFSPVISPAEIELAIRQRLTLTITSAADLERLAPVGEKPVGPVKVHLKIDTGLGRFGLDRQEALSLVRRMNGLSGIEIEGIYTHAADPASSSYTLQQFREFQVVVAALEAEGRVIPTKHMANSPVYLQFPEMQLDAVRIGTLISGQHPAGHLNRRLALQDPYKFKSRIISIKQRSPGDYLGYARTFKLKRAAQIAVIPVGLADGLGVEINNPPAGWADLLKKMAKYGLANLQWPGFELRVRIAGEEYPVRGKVFMQMALVEIPLGIAIAIGQEVELPIRKTLAAADLPRIYL